MHRLLLLLVVVAMAACTREETTSGATRPTQPSGPYANASMWLCGPDARPDTCTEADLSATRVAGPGSTDVVAHITAKDPAADCFYVYPTVRFEPECGNATNFDDTTSERFATVHQAARFSSVCRVIVPLYRQRVRCPPNTRDGVIGAEAIDDVAYDDVRAAFDHYLEQHNAGRPFFLIGHSQGADILARLVTEEIAAAPRLRRRLGAAFLIGGDIFVPRGATSGGTLGDVPLCTSENQTGCAIAYRSFAASHPPIIDPNADPPRSDMACTNPASLGGGSAQLRATYLPNPVAWQHPLFDLRALALRAPSDASTPHLLFERTWSAQCVQDDLGQSYLAIRSEGREDWIDFGVPFFDPTGYGTHALDFQFALGDLIHLVEAKTKSMEGSRRPG